MQDIPLFSTQLGIASLALREIPYRRLAYIRVRDVQPADQAAFLGECIGFCRAAGAERILALGAGTEDYPVRCSVLRLRGQIAPGADTELTPVTPDSVDEFRAILNRSMIGVDCASTLEKRENAHILASSAFFVRREGTLLGLGWLEGRQILALCAARSGAGEQVLRSLAAVAGEGELSLEVASTNLRALRLYRRVGMRGEEEIARWHTVMDGKSRAEIDVSIKF